MSTHDWTGPLTGLVPYRYFGIRKPEQLGPKGARGGHDYHHDRPLHLPGCTRVHTLRGAVPAAEPVRLAQADGGGGGE